MINGLGMAVQVPVGSSAQQYEGSFTSALAIAHRSDVAVTGKLGWCGARAGASPTHLQSIMALSRCHVPEMQVPVGIGNSNILERGVAAKSKLTPWKAKNYLLIADIRQFTASNCEPSVPSNKYALGGDGPGSQ